MLEKADKLYRTWSVEDIKNHLPDLVLEFTKIDLQAIEQEKSYEIERIRVYVKLKKEKKAKISNYSDKDIDYMSKHKALEKFWDYMVNRKVANHYKLYIDRLSDQIINLNVLNKAMRELK